MMGKLLGAALVLAAALWFVLARLRARRRQTALLRELAAALDAMAAPPSAGSAARCRIFWRRWSAIHWPGRISTG